METLKSSVLRWQKLSDIGKRTATQKYHAEIAGIILQKWKDPERDISTVAEKDVLDFVVEVAHYSAPRYNAIVSALRVILPAARSLKRRRVQVKERVNLSQKQFTVLVDELDKRPRSQAGLVVRFLAYTGLRIKEARKLRWSDVKPDGILLPGIITKNGRPRFIPFVGGIEPVLERLRRVHDGETILPHASVKRSLHTACRLAEVPRLSHHDFRHLFATRCIESGVDMPTVARWLGHQDGGALLGRVYFHLNDSHSAQMARRVIIA